MSKSVIDNIDLAFNAEMDAGTFQKIRQGVIRSTSTLQDRYHRINLVCLREFLKPDAEGKPSGNTDWIKWWILDLSPFGGSVRVQAVIHWFETFGGLIITLDEKKGTVSVKKDKKSNADRTVVGFSEARSKPYYKIAPPEKPVSMPEIKYTAAAAMLARRELLGEEPNWEEQLEELKKAYQAAKTSKGLQSWKEKAAAAIEEGTLTLIDPAKATIGIAA